MTPPKWRISPDKNSYLWNVIDEHGALVCSANEMEAELIVRAVNSHQVLIHACQKAVALCDANYDPSDNWNSRTVQTLRAALRIAAGQEVAK